MDAVFEDAFADLMEAAEFLGVEMDHRARPVVLVPVWCRLRQSRCTTQARTLQDFRYGRVWQSDRIADHPWCPAACLAQLDDLRLNLRRCTPRMRLRDRRQLSQGGIATLLEALLIPIRRRTRDPAFACSTPRRITLKNQIDTTTTILPGMTNPTWRRNVHLGLRLNLDGVEPQDSPEARPNVNRLTGS